KEYIEFLLDETTTDDRGQIAFDQWVLHGKSAPAEMDMAVIDLTLGIPGDLNGDGVVGAADLLILLASWGPCGECQDCPADLDVNGKVCASDLLILLVNWG
ncbi:MAG: dockerin type I domain-containing protein, partial [Phycisphaerales bacterium]